jgi:hypothetical protein
MFIFAPFSCLYSFLYFSNYNNIMGELGAVDSSFAGQGTLSIFKQAGQIQKDVQG